MFLNRQHKLNINFSKCLHKLKTISIQAIKCLLLLIINQMSICLKLIEFERKLIFIRALQEFNTLNVKR